MKKYLVFAGLMVFSSAGFAADRVSILELIDYFATSQGTADYYSYFTEFENLGGLQDFDVPGLSIQGNYRLNTGGHDYYVKNYKINTTSKQRLNIGIDLYKKDIPKNVNYLSQFYDFIISKLGQPNKKIDYGYLNFEGKSGQHKIKLVWDRGPYRIAYYDSFFDFGTSVLHIIQYFDVGPIEDVPDLQPLVYLSFSPSKVINTITNTVIEGAVGTRIFVIDLNDRQLLNSSLDILGKIDAVELGTIIATTSTVSSGKTLGRRIQVNRYNGEYQIEYLDESQKVYARETGTSIKVDPSQRVF